MRKAAAITVPRSRPPGRLMHVVTERPLSGVAPGQTMVVYRGTRVLGQSTIDRAHRSTAAV